MSDITENGYYHQRLRDIKQVLDNGKLVEAVRECGVLFEYALRRLLDHFLSVVESAQIRDQIYVTERTIAGKDSNRTYRDFTLSDLVRLYQEAKIFDAINLYTERNIERVKRRITWSEIPRLRNSAAHEEPSVSPLDQDDAADMYRWLRLFLNVTGLASTEPEELKRPSSRRVEPPANCPHCKFDVRHGWNFCPACGTCISPTCAACLMRLEESWRACPYCDSSVRGNSAVDAKTKHEYLVMCRGAYIDHVVTYRERLALNQKRLELGLNVEEAELIEAECAPPGVMEYLHLAEFALADGTIDEKERSYLNRMREKLNIQDEVAREIEQALLLPQKPGEDQVT